MLFHAPFAFSGLLVSLIIIFMSATICSRRLDHESLGPRCPYVCGVCPHSSDKAEPHVKRPRGPDTGELTMQVAKLALSTASQLRLHQAALIFISIVEDSAEYAKTMFAAGLAYADDHRQKLAVGRAYRMAGPPHPYVCLGRPRVWAAHSLY